MDVGARSCRSARHKSSPKRMYGTMSASCSRAAHVSAATMFDARTLKSSDRRAGHRTSNGTDTKFASRVMGP